MRRRWPFSAVIPLGVLALALYGRDGFWKRSVVERDDRRVERVKAFGVIPFERARTQSGRTVSDDFRRELLRTSVRLHPVFENRIGEVERTTEDGKVAYRLAIDSKLPPTNFVEFLGRQLRGVASTTPLAGRSFFRGTGFNGAIVEFSYSKPGEIGRLEVSLTPPR